MNINLLKGKIAESGLNQQKLAPLVKISKNTLNKKVNGKTNFTTDEIERLCEVLGITSPDEKCNIFLS